MLESRSGQAKPDWYEGAAKEAWERAQAVILGRQDAYDNDYSRYADNPLGFCTEVLKERFTDEVVEVMNSVRDYQITVARSSTGVGKSFGAARIALWFYKTFPDSQVYLTAAPPLDNLRRILWGEVTSVVARHRDLFINDRRRSLAIIRNPLSFITCVSIPSSGPAQQRESKFSGKHAPHILFIVDEGDAVPDEVYRGIEGCMSGGHARLLVMFNPRSRGGFVYEKERDGSGKVIKISALNHPNVVYGRDIIPGAVTRDTTIRRINEWTRPLAEDEKVSADCFEVPNYLVGTTTQSTSGVLYPGLQAGFRKVVEPGFWYMVLGEYPSQSETQLINRTWIDAAVDRWKKRNETLHEKIPDTRPLIGVDVAEFGVDASAACLRYGSYVPRIHLWREIDSDTLATQLLALSIATNAFIVFVDATGVGSSVAPSMSRRGRGAGFRAVSVKIAEKPSMFIKSELGEFFILKDQLWWAVREWLRTDPNSMIPPDPYLIEELNVPTYDIKNGKIRVMSKEIMRSLLRRSPDRADALCLTFYPQAKAKVLSLSTQ